MQATPAPGIPRMRKELRKYAAVFSIFFQDSIAYSTSWFIWIVGDVMMAITMPLVWAAAARANHGTVQGFDVSSITIYYLVTLLLGAFITSHLMWDIANEIRDGQFSSALMKPISFFGYTLVRNLAIRVMRPAIFLPFFIGILFLFRHMIHAEPLNLGWEFWGSVILGHLVSFTFIMAMSMIALFTQEAYSIFELYYVPLMFLSGQMFPIAMLPNWIQKANFFLPFYYTIGLPTEILIGKVTGAAILERLLLQVVWIGVSFLTMTVLWRRGLREYTGIGM